MGKKVTIQDIADALGLSRNTVSKAINNSEGLAESTKQMILEKAVEMGYKQFSYVMAMSDLVNNKLSSDSPRQIGEVALFTTSYLTKGSYFATLMLDKFQHEISQLGYSMVSYVIQKDAIDSLTLPLTFDPEKTCAVVCVELFNKEYADLVCSLDLPVLFHTGIHRPTEDDRKYRIPSLLNMDPLRLDRIARSFPDLRIVAAHLGTSFYRVQAAQLTKTFPNVYTDLAGAGAWKGLTPEEVGMYMCNIMERDSKVHFKKLVFGSDCYVQYPEIQTEAIKHYLNICEKNNLDQETIDGIMGKTVAGWLNI